MSKVFKVAKWEYLEKIKTKTFIISLILTPAFLFVFMFLPSLLASKEDTKPKSFGIIDKTEIILPILQNRLSEKYKLPDSSNAYVFIPIITDSKNISEIKKEADVMVLANEFDGYVVISQDIMQKGTVEYRSPNVGNIKDIERLENAIEDIVFELKLKGKGVNPEFVKESKTNLEIKSVKITKTGEEKETGFLELYLGSIIFMMLLFFLIFGSGGMLLRSVVEEKSNRVIEVLLSSCSANDLMSGKILGLGALGITQVLIWGIIGVPYILAQGVTIVSLESIFYFTVYFILGYLLYASIFVTVGSLASTEQEAQTLTGYLSMLAVFPIALAFPAMQNPDSLLVKVFSYIPLFTPTFMMLRIPIQTPPIYEIILTIVILVLSVVITMNIAGKIFRIAILMYGKRPTLPEIMRWIKEK